MSRPYLFSAAFALLAASVPGQTFRVLSTTPASNARGFDTAGKVAIRLSNPVLPSSVSATSVRVLGIWSGPVPGQVNLDAAGTTISFAPARPLFAGEPVTVVVPNTLRDTNNNALAGGHTFAFWAASARGTRTFTNNRTVPLRRTGEGLIATYGVWAGDLDGDGSPDMTGANEVAPDYRVLLNDGCGNYPGQFTIYPVSSGQQPSPTRSADFNSDGRLDMVSGNSGGNAVTINLNNGSGGFLPAVNYSTGGFTHGVAVLDADGDGDFDVAAPNNSQVAVFLNNGNGTLGAPAFFDPQGNNEDNICAVDCNNDGKMDLYVGNLGSGDVSVLLGAGNGTFTFSSRRSCNGNPFQMAAGDFNGDAIPDAVTANSSSGTVSVMFGNGSGAFGAPTSYPVGSSPAAVDVGDLDGDGWLDLAVSNYGSGNFSIYFNTGNGTFANRITLASGRAGSCTTLVDFDRNGVLDIIATDEIVDEARLYAQGVASHASSQPMACGAALRINNFGARGGFATPAVGIAGDAPVFFGVSGAGNAVFAMFLGLALPGGFPLPPFGTLNLDPGQFLVTLLASATNPAGEALLAVPLPGLPLGATFTTQALVAAGAGFTFTNPETASVVR
jgi:hypothetical protein